MSVDGVVKAFTEGELSRGEMHVYLTRHLSDAPRLDMLLRKYPDIRDVFYRWLADLGHSSLMLGGREYRLSPEERTAANGLVELHAAE